MRNRVKNSAQTNEQFFRSIFENAQIGISFFNIDGRAVFSNRALHEMMGYSGEELSRLEKWDEIVHPDDLAAGGNVMPHSSEGSVTRTNLSNASFAATAAY